MVPRAIDITEAHRSTHWVSLMLLGAVASAILWVVQLILAPLAFADTDAFTFDSFDAQYTLTRDTDGQAALDVVETLVARFPDYPQNKGIIRDLNADYDGVRLDPEVISVTGASGAAIPYWVESNRSAVRVLTGNDNYVTGVQTYVIHYTLRNVVRYFADSQSDEWYWDINGTGWRQPFQRVTATLHVDPGLAGALNGQAACYEGSQGSTTRCTVDRQDGSTTFTASAGPLTAGQTATVAVGFASGTFVVPEIPNQAWWATWLPTGLTAVALVAGSGVWMARRRRWSDHPGFGVIVPEYLPPAGVTPLHAADLIRRGGATFAAEVIDLAVHRHLRILDKAGSGTRRGDFAVRYASQPTTELEQRFLQATFGHSPQADEIVELGKPSSQRARQVEAVEQQASREVLASGWRAPAAGSLPGWLTAVAASTAAGAAALAVIVGFLFGFTMWTLFTVVIAVGVLIAVAAAHVRPTPLTASGAALRDHLIGLREYMQLAERDRLAMLQSASGAQRISDNTDIPVLSGDHHLAQAIVRVYERLLPWAVLWGVESSWARVLDLAYERSATTPPWYENPTGFQAGLLAARLASFSTAATTAASAPTSSGGGSFSGGASGGGFAGGGGGGGGGGGR